MKKLIQLSIVIVSLTISANSFADFPMTNQTNVEIYVETVCNTFHDRTSIKSRATKIIKFNEQACKAGTLKHGKVEFTHEYFLTDVSATFKQWCPNFNGSGSIVVEGYCDRGWFDYCDGGYLRMYCY